MSPELWGLDVSNGFTMRFSTPFFVEAGTGIFSTSRCCSALVGAQAGYAKGIRAAIGSQWWLPDPPTLSAILRNPNARIRRLFPPVWIPEKAISRRSRGSIPPQIESRSLTLSKVRFSGHSHIFFTTITCQLFYGGSDCSSHAKIWPNGGRLY